METGKPGLASAPAHMSSVAAQTEQRMDVQAPLTAVYFHTVPALPTQPFPQPSFAAQDPSALHLTMPPLYSKETLPFLTLHIASGLQSGMSVTAAAPAAKPKSSGKHMCPHCGRDCMKPSVLEKHLRCHTGERPYPCTVCGVSFKTQSNLYKHKRTQAHARLSSESEQSNLGSLESMSRSTETTSLSVEERSDESAGAERDASLPVAEKIPVVNQTLEQNEQSLKAQEHAKLPKQDDKPTTETERPTPPSSRHLLLQRQEATLFSKQWESSVSSSKSQSHESTDSGFSESSDHYPSPGSLLPDHSMDSLTESTTEHLEDSASQQQQNQEGKDTTKEQEHKTLEERISKLISENSAVVEDKHLENVRPRKTVLSKQGSIDLPMPYTYKDSFHFDMRINKMSNVQRNRKPGLYNSVPTQQSTTMEHAPLTRSNSLPFSVTLLQPDRSSPTTSYHKDYTTLFRRGSSGQIHPTGFSNKSVNQQLSTHRPLVRQAAVDCNHATDALFKNSSVEEACTSSLRCNGEPADICGEPSNRKFRRKKAQKFAYNKWYMYGGGTFKKLYETERGSENSTVKGMKSLPNPESEIIHSLQKRQSAGHSETTVVSSPSLARSATVHNLESYPARLQLMPSVSFNTQTSHIFASSTPQRMPLRRNLSLSVLPLPILSVTSNQNIDPHTRSEASNLVIERPYSASQSQVLIPSDRKKQRTDDKPCPQEMETDPNFTSQLTPSISTMPQPNLSQIIIQPKPAQVSLFPASAISANSQSASNTPATSISSAVQSSFMPKYQLKLPSAAESNSSSSLNVGSKPTQKNISTSVSSVTTLASTKLDTVTSIWTHQKDNNCSSAPSQILPCTVSQTQTPSQVNVISPSAIVQQHSMADTKTTASLRNSHAGLFSTLIQCSPFGSAVPATMSNKSISGTTFTSIHRTQSAPAAFTQSQDHLSSQKSLPSPLTQSSQSSGSNADSNIPVMPCQVVPGQQAVPKVFHVQTADLQICFQIISDEQLALIEPQIEKQTVGSLSQTGQVHSTGNQVQSSVTPQSTDKESDQRQSGQNKEIDALSKGSATPSISNKSEKEQPNVHMTISTAQSPALSTHPRICSQVNKVRKPLSPERAEVSTAASLKGAMSEKTQITQNKHDCHFAAQEQFSSDAQKCKGALVSHALLDEEKRNAATVTCISHSPGNNERTNCVENEIKFKNERDLCSMSKANDIPKVVPTYLNSSSENKQTCSVLQVGSDRGANETCTRPVLLFPNTDCRNSRQTSPYISVTRSNLQLSMVSPSLSQAKPGPEKDGLTHDSTLPHDAGLEQSALVTSASTDVPLAAPRDAPAASPNFTTGPEEGGSLVGCVEPQSQGHSRAPVQPLPEQSHEPLGTDRTGLCYTQLESKAENCGVRADSFLTCWLSEQHLQPLSQTPSGMCEYPPESSGPALDLSNTPGLPASNTHNTDFGNSPPPSSLLKTSCYLPQHTESGTEHSNKLKEPRLTETYQTVSHIEAGYQEIGTFREDQRQVGGAENAVVSCSSTNYTSQSHTTELTGNYQSNSSVFNNPLRQSNTVHSEHISRDDPPQACDSLDGTSKFPSLFGMGHSYSYQLADPQSSAVRVVQSSIDVEDSSSDDEGKLIIEL